MAETPSFDRQFFLKLTQTKMPFGKYEGRFLSELPEDYLLWFSHKGFPKGELGEMLESILEIKRNGLDHLLKKNAPRKR